MKLETKLIEIVINATSNINRIVDLNGFITNCSKIMKLILLDLLRCMMNWLNNIR